MKLEGVRDGRVYATSYRSVLVDSGRGFERFARLPLPTSGMDAVRCALRTTRLKSAMAPVIGDFPSVNVWMGADGELVATTGRWVFASRDGGATWDLRPTLDDSSGPMGVLPSGICEHEGGLFLGEYPLDDDATPRILRSVDAGRQWRTVLELPGVRHVHSVTEDPYTGEVWITTGDRDPECRIGRLVDGEFDVVGGGAQRWRAVEPAFTPTSILWGVDCGYASRNEIVRLDRDELDGRDPAAETVHAEPNSVFYSASFSVDGVRWVAFSTAIETRSDSTAPGRDVRGSESARVVAASSESDFEEWIEVASYRKRQSLADRFDRDRPIPNANAYVFLAADPGRGLILNPYNTARDSGAIVRVPPEFFED